MRDLDGLSVEVKRQVFVEGDDREGHWWRRAHPSSYVVVREDYRTSLAEVLVSADVIPMHVNVQQEADRPFVKLRHGRADLLRERGELVVDQE